MSEANKIRESCPWCGSTIGQTTDEGGGYRGVTYECGSYFDRCHKAGVQTQSCRIRELERQLADAIKTADGVVVIPGKTTAWFRSDGKACVGLVHGIRSDHFRVWLQFIGLGEDRVLPDVCYSTLEALKEAEAASELERITPSNAELLDIAERINSTDESEGD